MPSRTSSSRRLPALLVAVPFVVAACATAANDPTDEPAMGAITDAAATADVERPGDAAAPAEDAAVDPAADAAAEPTWLDIELSDAQTGEAFTLADFEGGVVALEPMAVWCSNCKVQQDNAKEVYDQIEASGVTYISLGIDPGEDPAALAKYAERRGYDWTFVQSPTEFSRALNDLFGPQILSAPSTPLIVLDAGGDVVFQDFGFHGPDELLGILDGASA